MKRLRLFLTLALLVGSLSFAADKPAGNQPSINQSLLPAQFAGWQMSGSAEVSKDPAAADPVNAAVLKEYGFTDFESANYMQDDGRKVAVKAARFQDASGSYGAFTYYKMPQMLVEKIGGQGASLNERVLFYQGNVLVDAVFSRLTAMSAAELRELAAELPPVKDNAAKLPGLPAYLPRQSYVKNSAKYVMGPVTLDKLNAPLAGSLIGFDAGAEVVLGDYATSGGEATMMLIAYPTPQIAADHLRRIEDARHQAAGPSDSAGASIIDKRTGPIVAVVTGPVSQSDAKALLASVNYDADVTWNQNTFFDKKNNLANLLVNVVILCGVILGIMLVAGFAFGGVRILMRKVSPTRAAEREHQMEFISLHLEEESSKPPVKR
jgi:hypothetical protein